MSIAAGDLIAGRYRLAARIGQGGQGRIWRARDEMLSRDVAVKELVPPSGMTDKDRDEMRERSLREARAIAQFDHPNVVQVFDVIRHDGEPWIVMELVAARSLSETITSDGRMTPEAAGRTGLSVLSALKAAHLAGVLHRDVKPANVLIADNGRVLLTDFGLAAIAGDGSFTETGMVLGSPAYLAPERAMGEDVGPPSDLWSLGATLYAAVEGRPMYAKSTPVATLAAVATERPAPPQHAGALMPVLEGLLRRDPAKRFTAERAEQLLRQVVAGQAPVAAPTEPVSGSFAEEPTIESVSPAERKSLSRRGAVLAVVAVLTLAGLGSLPLIDKTLIGLNTAAAANLAVSASAAPPPADPGVAAGSGTPTTAPTPTRTAVPSPGHPAVSGKPPAHPTAPPSTPAKTVTPKSVLTAYQFIGQQSGLCIEVPGQTPRQDQRLHLWSCRADAAGQRWTFPADGTVRSGGMCLDTRQGLNAPGTAIVMDRCVAGVASQKFRVEDAGDLVNVQANACVDAKDDGTSNGTQLQLWSCAGTQNQKWRRYPLV